MNPTKLIAIKDAVWMGQPVVIQSEPTVELIKAHHPTCETCSQRTYTFDDFCMLTGHCITDLTNYCKFWKKRDTPFPV